MIHLLSFFESEKVNSDRNALLAKGKILMKSRISLAIRATISLTLMIVLIYMVRDSMPKMFDSVKRLPLSILFLGFLLFWLSVLIVSYRLKILLATQEIFLNIANIVKLNFMGYFFSSFLPTSVGGDVVKAFFISKTSNKAISSYTSVFIDRFLGMASIFFLATGALFYTKEIPSPFFNWFLPLLSIVSGIFLVFIFNKSFAKKCSFLITPFVPIKIWEKLRDIYNALYDFKKYKIEMLNCILISLFGQVIAFSATYFFALGLKSHVPIRFVLLAMPVASIVSMLPSIYGMGPREMSIVIIMGPIIGEEKALAIAFLWLAILLITALVGGIIYAFTGLYKIKVLDITSLGPGAANFR